ncbi:hypothetical protein CARUB_v10025103mg [Capsella rubella]|uniref:DNA-directed RNA polymerase III subunit RPC3 n=1 Tax=Capsella rubella TaxID=81985 RepID=R0HGP3_9BRAS|nr:uncharacterized protein LOC17889581 [Capsella rubella]EOA28859.1 hypothetical protein CARUB_v10025103mg [Capsella rubella]
MTTSTTEFAILYAVHIITIQFGSVVSKVCECLLRKGPLSLREIFRLAESQNINHDKVKDVLYILIQHNCVQAYSLEPPDGNESKGVVQYLVLVNNILHRVRYNKFSKVVNEELGTQCSAVLDHLLRNGRLTLGQLIEIVTDHQNTKTSSEEIREYLQKLVDARFVERVPSPEPVLENKEQGKKRGVNAAKILKESKSLEERVLEAATPVEALRFPLLFQQASNSSLPDINDDNIKRKRDVDASESSNEIIWRPNFGEFIRRLRHKACVKIVNERMDKSCAAVLKAMLEVGRCQEKTVTTDKSVPMLVSSIYEEVIKTKGDCTILLEQVEACLDQLSSASSYLPAFAIETDDSYIVDFKSIINVAQRDEMEALVMRRYGKEAFRMFRYLSSQEECFVETDKIADATLTEKKDTWNILMKMWKDGYLHMQKLVTVTSVYMPFYLWKVNKLIVSRKMLDEMYHASLNLSLKCTHKLDSKEEANKKLKGALFELDDAIMIFHDF